MERAKNSFASRKQVERRIFLSLLPAIIMIIVGLILWASSWIIFENSMKINPFTPQGFESRLEAMDLFRITGTTGSILNFVAMIWIIVVAIYWTKFSRRDPEREPHLK